jgi:hypothetical protein
VSGLALSERDRRTLVVGAALVGGLLVGFRGVPAWRERFARERAAASHLAVRAAEAEAAVRGSRVRADSLDARRRRFVDLAPAVLDGRTPAAAGATLAAIVSGAAARAGLQVNSVQVRPDSAGPGTFTRVSVHADATGDVRGIAMMLELLERGPELLAVRSVAVSGAQPSAPDTQPEALHLELTVEGLALSRAASDSASAPEVPLSADSASPGQASTASPSSTQRSGGRAPVGRAP